MSERSTSPAAVHATGTSAAPELEHAMQALTAVSNDLLGSYRALEERAQEVQLELNRTNKQLAEKVAELDAVTRDLEAILESLPVGVVVRSADGRVVRANPAVYSILGYDESDPARANPELVASHGALAQRSDTGEPAEVDCPDGATRFISSRYSSIRDAREETTGSVEILDDRTEITALNERLHQLDKLAALGNMAGGIAHEVRNPMNAVKGFAALLEKKLPGDSKERSWAQLIVRGVSEADEILSSMLTLANPERLFMERTDARELVDAAIEAAVGSVTESPADVEITTDVQVDWVVADRVKLRQVLRNLISNAIQAQTDGAKVHIAVTREGEEVLFCVRDAGPGIPADLRRRVFDPFFTTRAEGTGLGLALVSTIARLHGGRVEIPTQPRATAPTLGGAEINLFLPQA